MRGMLRRWRWRFVLDLVFFAGVTHTLITGQLVPAPLEHLLASEPAVVAAVDQVEDALPLEPIDLPAEAAEDAG